MLGAKVDGSDQISKDITEGGRRENATVLVYAKLGWNRTGQIRHELGRNPAGCRTRRKMASDVLFAGRMVRME